MRAVVTGGAGFIGSHLIEHLLREGHEILCIERDGASTHWLDGLDIETVFGGVEDEPGLCRSLDGANVVFHLAGLTEARTPGDYYRVNTNGTATVLRAAAAQGANAPRVILMSSIAALGPCRNGDLLSPDTVPFPMSHYGHSKLLAEAVMHAWADRVPATVLRLPSVYGPREKAALTMFKLVHRGVALTVGDWDREFSLLYVKDLARGLLACAQTPVTEGRTYCMAHPEAVTWRSFATQIGEVVGRSPHLVSVPRSVARVIAVAAEAVASLRHRPAILNRERVREMTQQRWVCDPSRAMTDFGFAPEYPVRRGVAETTDWYRMEAWL
jgi:nucleoside-diphosphate-sugar epimerase